MELWGEDMLSGFYKKFSLDNLKKDKPCGQISTLLILMIVVILIMILTTVNLGQLSLSTTNLSNVADSSAMYLASQLATRSYALYKSLGNSTCKCQSGGFGGLLGAIIGAVIAIVITYVTAGTGGPAAWAVVAAAAAGGAVGGAAGAAYSGTSVFKEQFKER
jgi:ABC-type cobalt transport system substrate-binding protein